MCLYDVGDSRDSIAIRYVETGTNATSLPKYILLSYYIGSHTTIATGVRPIENNINILHLLRAIVIDVAGAAAADRVLSVF